MEGMNAEKGGYKILGRALLQSNTNQGQKLFECRLSVWIRLRLLENP